VVDNFTAASVATAAQRINIAYFCVNDFDGQPDAREKDKELRGFLKHSPDFTCAFPEEYPGSFGYSCCHQISSLFDRLAPHQPIVLVSGGGKFLYCLLESCQSGGDSLGMEATGAAVSGDGHGSPKGIY